MKFLYSILFSFTVLFAQPTVPQLEHWANDFTNTLTSNEINSLDISLKTYQDTTSNQLVFLMVPTLNDYPLEYYSMEVAEKNKIGTKERDNGVLFLVVKNDRKMRIEVGYGLEGVLPDALSSSIIRNIVAPHFKRDEYFAGINDGVNAMISAIAGEYIADNSNNDEEENKGLGIFIFIIFIIIMSLIRTKKGRSGFIFFPGGFSGGSGGSVGGFGGFSGGGGSFGGGGASGGW